MHLGKPLKSKKSKGADPTSKTESIITQKPNYEKTGKQIKTGWTGLMKIFGDAKKKKK